MNDDKIAELQRLFTKQESELLLSLSTIRKQMKVLDGENHLFRLFINNYTKNPIYYAHLFDDDGKQTDARMSCKTTDKEKATLYAIEHREAFLKDYFSKKNKNDFYTLLTEYYTEKSELFKKARNKRNIRDQQVKKYKGFIDNYFIPFLQNKKITSFEKANNIDIIEEFQLYCQDEKQNNMGKSLTAKTLNDRVDCAVAPIFNQVLKEKSLFLIMKNINVKAKEGEKKSIGVIPIRTTFSILLNDFFWQKVKKTDTKTPFLVNNIRNIEKYRLYCLLSNLCGLRNGEIVMLKKENITLIGKTHFLSIENSRIDGTGTKTEAGKRLVPLHPFIYQKLLKYIEDEKRTDYIFYNGSKVINSNDSGRARTILALLCGYDNDDIHNHNIVFHSFRHFFKTMISNVLYEKDLVEYYMGHKNNNDMSKNYLHLGNVGNQYIEENGKKIIGVIEKYFRELFKAKTGLVSGKYDMSLSNTLQKPVIKETIYDDVAHYRGGKKYLIWTIPDPEAIEDVSDFDDEKIQNEESLVEIFNNRNTGKWVMSDNFGNWDPFDGHDEIDSV
jgi:integrase